MHDYVITSAPEFQGGLDHIDAIPQEPDHYRACVPGADERHSLCLFVRTDQSPPGITRDTSQVPEQRVPPAGRADKHMRLGRETTPTGGADLSASLPSGV